MTGAVHFVCTYHVYAGRQQWRSCGAVFGSLDALIQHREAAHDIVGQEQRRAANKEHAQEKVDAQ